MPRDDRAYFSARAEAELKMAQAARNPEATRAHYTLAGHYLDRAHGGDERNQSALLHNPRVAATSTKRERQSDAAHGDEGPRRARVTARGKGEGGVRPGH